MTDDAFTGWVQAQEGPAPAGRLGPGAGLFYIDEPDRGEVPCGMFGLHTNYLTPQVAREFAVALLRCADAAERERGR